MRALPEPSTADAVVDLIRPGTQLVVPTANGEPVTVLDAIETAAGAGQIDGVRVHQVLPLRDRPHHAGTYGERMRHVSYFLSSALREHFERRTIDLVPNDLHNIPAIVRSLPEPKLLVLSTSPPDRHGYLSLGTAASYTASLLGEMPVFAEANAQMPRTTGGNQLHLSEVAGWCEADYPLVTVPPPQVSDTDLAIGQLVAERVPDGATIQIGFGSVPDAVAGALVDHRHLGIHSELFSDGLRRLIESGAATGACKTVNRHVAVTADALGTAELLEFLHENLHVEFWPVDYTNDPRTIAGHRKFTAVNATMEIDLLGQCASESLGTHYVSSSGGQSDFMSGAALSDGGQSFIVTHSTAKNGSISRIRPTLTTGAVVTTHKNVVDKVVTEFGVAELRGRTVADRARALIGVAHPDFRDELSAAARSLDYL